MGLLMEAALVALANRVSSLDAAIAILALCITYLCVVNKGVRVPTTMRALTILGLMGAGVFIARLLVFLADQGIIGKG